MPGALLALARWKFRHGARRRCHCPRRLRSDDTQRRQGQVASSHEVMQVVWPTGASLELSADGATLLTDHRGGPGLHSVLRTHFWTRRMAVRFRSAERGSGALGHPWRGSSTTPWVLLRFAWCFSTPLCLGSTTIRTWASAGDVAFLVEIAKGVTLTSRWPQSGVILGRVSH